MNRLSQILSSCAVAFAVGFARAGESQIVGDYTWYYTLRDGTALLSNTPNGPCHSPDSTGTLEIPASLGGVSSIGFTYDSFSGSHVKKVIFPNTYTTAYSYGLRGCTTLEEVDLTATPLTDLTNFQTDPASTNIKIIRLPSTLRAMWVDAFGTGVSEVHVPSPDAWCEISLERNSSSYDSYIPTLAKGLRFDGQRVTDLSALKEPHHVGWGAFAGNLDLKSALLPASVTNIGAYAFTGCTNLSSHSFGSARAIGDHAYAQTGLREVVIPDKVSHVGRYAFSDCLSLTNVVFEGALGEISDGLFRACLNLQNITWPRNLNGIGMYAFSECSSLTEVDVPEGVTFISYCAFSETRNLKRVILPGTLTMISNPFWHARILETVEFRGDCPQEVYNIFSRVPDTLYTIVPNLPSWQDALLAGTWQERRIVSPGTWTVTYDFGGRGHRTGGGETVQQVEYTKGATPPTGESDDENVSFAGWDRDTSFIGYTTVAHAVYTANPLQLKGSSSFETVRFQTNEVALAALGGVKPYAWALSDDSSLPEGYVLTSNGVVCVSSSAEFLGTRNFNVTVTDASNTVLQLTFTLTAAENPNAKPVVDAQTPTVDDAIGSEASARTFSIAAHDPEGGALAYRWLVDGVERQYGADAAFAYTAPADGAETHALVCQVEDSVWKGAWTTAASWTVRTLTAPTFDPGSGTVFTEGAATVTLTSNVAGATLYYSTNGNAPRTTDAFRYTGPIAVTESIVVKAIAAYGGCVSPYATARYVCATPAFTSAVGAPAAVTFTTEGDALWTVVSEADAPDGDTCLGSGAIGSEQTSSLVAHFSGKGTFSFVWKVDCEWDDSGDCTWDAVRCYVDGAETPIAAADGTTDWQKVSFDLAVAGDHTVEWVFEKDDYDEDGADYADCAWLDCVRWSSGEPLPELDGDATAADIAAVFAEAGDRTRLVAHLTTGAKYAAFRTWAKALEASGGPNGSTIKAHARAWPSFALGLDRLIDRELVDDDFVVRTFAPSGTAGSFSLTASVGDWTIGSGATAENLATVIGVIGSSELDPEKFSSKNVSVTFGDPVDGYLSLTVSPVDASASSFFMRLHAGASD